MSLNEHGAFYHLLGDAGGSVAVIISTAAVAVFDLPIADPVAAVLIALLVLWSAGRVLRESTSILLQRSPIATNELKAELAGLDGVQQVDDLHVWQVCSQLTVGTVRIVDTATTLDERQQLRSHVHERLVANGIDHATVELTEATESSGDQTNHTKHTH
jgi:cobalt-zinc-cadmium efflux system protein